MLSTDSVHTHDYILHCTELAGLPDIGDQADFT
jgi:hypothetical protein